MKIKKKADFNKDNSSFRDPGGFVFRKNDQVYRAIKKSAILDYQKLMQSGLYDELQKKQLLIKHHEVKDYNDIEDDIIQVIHPDKIDTISYPYEWCFSQLKDAALLTLKITKVALSFDMILKDASAYNIQFVGAKPIFIDTLSFVEYEENMPWEGYQQYCRHFLSPLVLMSKLDHNLNTLTKNFIDGVPLELTAKLLPFKSLLSLGLFAHVYLHSKSQIKHADSDIKVRSIKKVSKTGLLGIIDSLESTINKLTLNSDTTEWGDYYDNTNYSAQARDVKENIVYEFLSEAIPKTVWDLGANEGVYSRLARKTGASVVSWDIDPIAVEKNYLALKKDGCNKILPLIQDLTNPSPGIGWANCERESFTDRANVDVVMALALIHHLAISNNIPFEKIAEYFSYLCNRLIIEFVPKSDSQVKKLLLNREDIFTNYNEVYFEVIFKKYFNVISKKSIQDSGRTIYLMQSVNEKE